MENSSELENTNPESAETSSNKKTGSNKKTTKTSTSETGHAKNVANFEALISYCTAYGSSYNPTKNNIKLTQLSALRTTANTALQTVKTTKNSWDIATNARETTFDGLKKLATRVINALESTDASALTIEDVHSINRKIQGQRAPSSSRKSENPENQVSVSQQSFDSLTDAFTKMVSRISAEPLYVPNETDLKTTALNTVLTNMKTANTNAINSETAYSNALIARNNILYHTETGMKATSDDVKKYVKSVFGPKSPQFEQVSKLKFIFKKP